VKKTKQGLESIGLDNLDLVLFCHGQRVQTRKT
jgi:hypothetical protein